MADYGESPVTDPDSIGYVADGQTIAQLFGIGGTENTTDELLIDYTNKKIALKVQDGLGDDGITLKAIYSKLKDAWQSDTSDSGSNVLIRFPFPMVPITDEQFQLVEGWNWDNTQTSGTQSAKTPELIRTGGWQVLNTSNQITEEWAGVISLGDLPAGTQVYYDQKNDETITDGTTTNNFKLTRKVNQAVQIYSDVNGDGSPDYNYRGYFKMFVREWQRTYSASDFSAIGVTTATYQAYRFPLTNTADLKVPHAEAIVSGTGIACTASSDGNLHTYTVAAGHGVTAGEKITTTGLGGTLEQDKLNVANETVTAVTTTTIVVDAASPAANTTTNTGGTLKLPVFDNMFIEYARDGSNNRVVIADIKGDHNTGGVSYVIGDVVKSTNSQWYITIVNHTSTATDPSSDATNFEAYDFDREISAGSGVYYAFNVAIDGDDDTANFNDGAANTKEIYEFSQYKLRQGSNIDETAVGVDNSGVVNGKTADQILTFVGDTLITSQGVYVDSFEAEDINSIDFTDYTNTVRRYDFVAFLQVNFGQNLIDDTAAIYKVFFTTSDDGNFGQSTAELVETNTTGTFMEGTISGASSVSLSYNYDGNIQRGGGTGGTDANITAVAIGLTKGQYVKATSTIARSKTNSVSLVAALERNYDAGSV
jgi:hypothetical protein